MFSIDLAEKLKAKLTDRFVVVDPSIAELKRFAQWTGKVRTVNMNGRALVEFDGPVDIGWYDIDPAFLTVVDAPVKRAPASHEAPAKAATPAPAPADKPAGGVSPLEAARAQGAAKPAGAKLSPLEMIRQQQAAKAAGSASAPVAASAPDAAAPAAAPPANPTPAPAAVSSGKPLSKLDMIRAQGAAKKSE